MARERDSGFAPTLLDRLVEYVAPERYVKRIAARHTIGAIHGYVAGDTGRRSFRGWSTAHRSADADFIPEANITRGRSRDLVRNNAAAAGAVGGTVTAVVGTGLMARSAIDAKALGMAPDEAQAWNTITDREFAIWAESTDCDITRTQDLYGLQDLVFRSTLESGDAISLLPMVARRSSTYDLRIQVIEADRLANKNFSANTPTLVGGVEMDLSGAPVAYHILRQHPGALMLTGTAFEWDIYPAFGARTGRRNVLHHFRRVRPGQTRGVPFLAPVVEQLRQLGVGTNAELMAMVVSGLFTVFVTSERGGLNAAITPGMASETGATTTDDDVKIGNGNIVDLQPGEDVKAPAPGRPNPNFDPFFLAIMRQIGMATEIPYEILIKHFSASYSASRAAVLEAWKFYLGRRAWLVQSFCDPVREAWMEEAIAKGRIRAPGFFDNPAIRRAYLGCLWHGDAMPQIDPVKEVEAARIRVALGVSDRKRETAMLTGGDWETTNEQQIAEANARRKGGLDPDVPPAPTVRGNDPTDGGDNPQPTENG